MEPAKPQPTNGAPGDPVATVEALARAVEEEKQARAKPRPAPPHDPHAKRAGLLQLGLNGCFTAAIAVMRLDAGTTLAGESREMIADLARKMVLLAFESEPEPPPPLPVDAEAHG